MRQKASVAVTACVAVRLAAEIVARHPGSVDTAGAPLDNLPVALKRLRGRE
jgi:hypothetical protein